MFDHDETFATLQFSGHANIVAVLGLLTSCVLLALVILAPGAVGRAGLIGNQSVQYLIAAVLGAWVVLAFVYFFKHGTPQEADDKRLARRQIDLHQSRWRWMILLNVVTSFLCVFSLNSTLLEIARSNRIYAVAAGAILVLLAIVLTMMVSVGPVWSARSLLNDEFVRALRAKATRLGYFTLTILTSGAFLTALIQPDLAIPVLSWSLFGGFAIPAVYYVVADWRSDRSE